MWRYGSTLALVACMGLAGPALAQGKGKGGKDDFNRLQAEIGKLREQIQDMDARIKKLSEGLARSEAKGDKKDEWLKMVERFKEKGKGFEDKDKAKEFFKKWMEAKGKPGEKKKGPPEWAKKGKGDWAKWARERESRRDSGRGGAEMERRLDRIIRELEEMRREMKRK